MKHKTAELEGELLDHAVAVALGGELLEGDDGWTFDPPLALYGGIRFIKTKRSFCEGWEYGGPLIERERIELGYMGEGHGWQAAVNPFALADYSIPWVDGPTPLIAAMRAFVVAKLGEEVEIP